jgi:hypothetical protein
MTANEVYLVDCCCAVRVVLQRVAIEPTAEQTAAWVVLYLAGDDKVFQERLYPDVLLVAEQVTK